MIGVFILGLLGLWLWFAIWLANKLSSYLWRHSTTQSSVIALARNVTTIVLLLLLFLLPFWDQLIAYPKWQQLCSTTGDFEWGPGMDEKKAFGRDVVVVNERVTTTTIFPNIKVDYSGWYVFDAKTQELIFKKPHYSYSAEAFLYMPSGSGNKTALFLPTCKNYTYFLKSDDIFKRLNLIVIEHKGMLK